MESTLREYIYSLPNHHDDDTDAYEEYAIEEGWDLDTLYTPDAGKERATAFLTYFQHSNGITSLTAQKEPITVQRLYCFLQKLMERNPSASEMTVTLFDNGDIEDINSIQVIDEDTLLISMC